MKTFSINRRAVFVFGVFLVGAILCAVSLYVGNLSLAICLAAAAFLTVMLVFSGRKNQPVFISLTSVMTALSVVGRMVFAPISGFKPCTAVIIITGASMGAEAGFICGAFTALISNIYFGQGMWTLFQMLSWGIIGLLAGILGKALRQNKFFLYAFSAISGVLYSVIMDLFSVIWQDGGFNAARFLAMAVSSMPFAAIYAFSNVIFIALMFGRLSFALDRVMRKYGLKK